MIGRTSRLVLPILALVAAVEAAEASRHFARMAHAALDRTTQQLAEAAEIGGKTINRFERGGDARVSSVDKAQQALEVAGIEFIPENGGGQGVWMQKAKKGRRL